MRTTIDSREDNDRSQRSYWGAVALWAAAGLVLAATGTLDRLPRQAIPLFIWSPVLIYVVAMRRSAAARAWIDAIDLRPVVLYHLVRIFFGAAFLWELQRGRLPASFAVPAGVGDIVAGVLCVPAAALIGRGDRLSRALLYGWNLLALIDIVMVFGSAARLLFIVRDERFYETFRVMPYPTLPLVVVPLVIIAHLVVFRRLGLAQVSPSTA